VTILKEAESGIPVEELSRKHGFSKSVFYKWKSKYSEMDASSLRRLKELEEENQRLKRMFADLGLEHQALKDIIQKKTIKPDARRDLASYAMQEYGLSERQGMWDFEIKPIRVPVSGKKEKRRGNRKGFF